MTRFETLSNLRAGVVYGAAGVPPTTARNWSLALGTKTQGHPRYDVVDAACLMLMSTLVHDYRMSGEIAARIVNAVRPTLDDQARGIVAQLQLSGSFDRSPGLFAVITRTPWGGAKPENFLRIVRPEDLMTFAAEGHDPVLLLIGLQPIINKAIYRVDRVMGGELAEHDEA